MVLAEACRDHHDRSQVSEGTTRTRAPAREEGSPLATAARAPDDSGSAQGRLLHAYQETLDLARGLPWKTRLRHSDGPIGRHVRVYRLRFGLRYFPLHHMNTPPAAPER